MVDYIQVVGWACIGFVLLIPIAFLASAVIDLANGRDVVSQFRRAVRDTDNLD